MYLMVFSNITWQLVTRTFGILVRDALASLPYRNLVKRRQSGLDHEADEDISPVS